MPAEPTTRYRILTVLLATALATILALSVGPLARAVEGPVDYLYVATGENFPDALAGSTLAAARNAPFLLAQKNSIPQATKDALNDLTPPKIVILGGTATITDTLKNQLAAFATSGVVERIAGSNRYATAADIAAQLPEVSPGNVYHINLTGAGTVSVVTSQKSEPLRDAVIFRPLGSPLGTFCVNVPDGQFDVHGTVGTPVDLTVMMAIGTDSNSLCLDYQAEIMVLLRNGNGDLANGDFRLSIPGR